MRFPLKFLSDLLIRIYVVGFHKQGESIVLLFKNKQSGIIFYSIVIDSFMKNNVHKTIEILNYEHIDHLNILCWTHPDNDHSWGLDKLLDSKFCNKNTKFISPYGIESKNLLYEGYNTYQRRYLEKLEDNIKESNVLHEIQSVSIKQHNVIDSFEITDGINNIDVNILSLSPFSSMLLKKSSLKSGIERNDFSIVLSINIGSYKFLFTSDIMDSNIDNLNPKYFDEPLFIKIPHHGSDKSKKMIAMLKTGADKNTIAFTTRFSRQNLPKEAIVEQYKQKCNRVDYTGDSGTHIYGIIRYDVDLYGDQDVKCGHMGNARKL